MAGRGRRCCSWLGVDRDHDDADLAAARLLSCPVLVLWATRDDMEQLYGDPTAIWHRWAKQVQGAPIDSGHHIAEEAPAQLAARSSISCQPDSDNKH
jgi:haloacetate dehalogenase